MNNQTRYPKIFSMRNGGVSALALFTALSSVTPAFSTIDNTATASGTFDDGVNPAVTVDSPPDTANVPVLTDRNLSVVKSVFTPPTIAAGADPLVTDALDTIVYRYTVTNNGTTTENNVVITDVGPTFDTIAAVNSLGTITEVTGVGAGTGDAATLAPTETVVFEATYTFAELDILRAAGVADGISNIATTTSDDTPDSPPSPPAVASIPADTELQIVKTFVLNEIFGNTGDALAEAGDTIDYTYTVTNTGNVALTNVFIEDIHETVPLPVAPAVGSPAGEAITVAGPLANSDLGTLNNGIIDILAAGATATFTVTLTVTQDEVDDG